MPELENIEKKIIEIGGHVEEARAAVKNGITKAEAEERFTRLAGDLTGIQTEQRKLQEQLTAESEASLKRVDELEATVKRLGEASPDEQHRAHEGEYQMRMQKIARESGVNMPITTTAEEHRAAFTMYLQRGADNPLVREFMAKPEIAAIERRALSEGVLPEGGFLVDPFIETEIIKNAVNMSPFMGLARVTDINSNEWKARRRTDRPTAYWVGESGEPTKSNAKYGEISILAHMIGVETVVSTPLLQDVAYIESEIALDAAEEIGRAIGAAFVSGSGVGRPEGFTVNADTVAAKVTGKAASSDIVAWEDFGLLYAGSGAAGTGLQTKYRQNGTYVFNSATLAKVLQFASTAGAGGNVPILQLNVGPNGLTQNIIGKPYVILDDMQSDGTNGNIPMAFGDFRAGYRIIRRTGIFVIRDPYTAKPDVEFTWYQRIGGKTVLPEAIRLLVV